MYENVWETRFFTIRKKLILVKQIKQNEYDKVKEMLDKRFPHFIQKLQWKEKKEKNVMKKILN
jgi:hypothetical protein